MIVDNHCDVLYKLFTHPELDFQQEEGGSSRHSLAVSLPRIQRSDVRLQCFAIYISESVRRPDITHILTYVQLFHDHILRHPHMMAVRTASELEACFVRGKTGALLTLEGVDALQGHVEDVELLYRLGVRSIGITWNYANWAADGVLEPRQAALSSKGRALVKRCEELGLLLDCSHLCEPAFWELCERTRRPFIASHSNAYAVCPHPRNLRDEQINAIRQKGGILGLTFVPSFLCAAGTAKREHLLKHIDHMAALGAGDNLALGTDFDGTDDVVQGLEHAGQLESLQDWLLQYYAPDFVEGLMWRNAYRFYQAMLP